MKINQKKTKILIYSKQEDHRREPPIYIANERIQQIKEYKYLGSLITQEGTCKGEIQSRLIQAKIAFNKKTTLLTSRKPKKKVVKNVCLESGIVWMRDLDNRKGRREEVVGL